MDQLKPRLTVLRGIHTTSELPAIVDALKNVDIILVEFLGTLSNAKFILNEMNLLGGNEQTIKEYAADLEGHIGKNLHLALAWEFRGMGKTFYLVDSILADDTTPDSMNRYMVSCELDSAFDAIQNNPESRYSVLNAWVSQRVDMIRKRDKLVATQTKHILENRLPPEYQTKKPSYTAGLLIGFLHRPSTMIQRLLPNVEVGVASFEPQLLKHFYDSNPLIRLLWLSIKTKKPLSSKAIDYFFYRLSLLDDTTEADEVQDFEPISKLQDFMHQGLQSDASFKRGQEIASTARPIADFGEQELKQLADTYIRSS